MNHLSDDQLYAAVFDAILDEQTAEHLHQCAACASEYESLQRLAHTFAIAQRSQPNAAQIDRYQQMATHIQTQSSGLAGWIEQIQAVLAQDSRQRLAWQGVRSGGQQAYRLLYSADNVDVELLVDALGSTRSIEGEILPLADADMQLPLLVELQATRPMQSEDAWMVESSAQGRFRIEGVTLGAYDVIITPTAGPSVRIEGIDIT